MKKRLRNYLIYLSEIKYDNLNNEKTQELKEDLLTQISFFQHERLIHLLVTLTFAILSVASIITCLFMPSTTLMVLCGLFFVLLIPYVFHYYFLENGVQTLYTYYDLLMKQKY